ncbi:MAG: class I SAM-dependent methyltransferase [Alphaproteobacteria bacterium]|nr:class I SAM-dependent methyltransferase [Alphaproteobacteria bacterium]
MSGFSADWLALREPADHRARDAALAQSLAAALADRARLRIVDLGSGTGSNLGALAPILGRDQHWRLVDDDPALLAVSRARFAAAGLRVAVETMRLDLAADLDRALAPAPDLVTAAALLDLVSADWIARLVAAVAARRAAFYTVLTYDGSDAWDPPHAADGAMRAAFHAHQRRDKGFGPAAGPDAAGIVAQAFRRKGYRVETAPSPWRLGAEDGALIEALADGFAVAVGETGTVPAATVEAWRNARRAACRWTVGHVDILALPGAG